MTSNCKVRVFYCRNLLDTGQTPAALSELAIRHGLDLEPVPCSGRIDPRYLLKAFEAGSRAVCILTCPLERCKLIEGNLRAVRRVEAVKELMAEAGLNPDSLELFRPEGPGEEMLGAAIKHLGEFVSNQPAHEVNG